MLRPRSSKVSLQKVILCPFHWKPKLSGVSLESPEQENIPQTPRNETEVGQVYHARKAVSATLSVLKGSVAIFWPRSSKVYVEKVWLCPVHWKPRPSGVSLECPRLGIISQVPGNRAEVTQNHDARKAKSATLSVLKWSRAMLRPRSSKVSLQKVILCQFHCQPKPSGVSLKSPGLENIRQVPGNRAEVGQNHDACKAVSATLSVLKWSGAIFLPRSCKVIVKKVMLCAFHCKPRPSGVSLESLGLENIPQVPGNRAELGQNHDARKAVSATISGLKRSGVLFKPTS